MQERIAARLRAKNYIPTIEEQVALRWRIAQLRSEVDSAKREIGAVMGQGPCRSYRRYGSVRRPVNGTMKPDVVRPDVKH